MADAIECPECGGNGVKLVVDHGGMLVACDHAPRPAVDRVAVLRAALARLLRACPDVLHGDRGSDDCVICEAERALEMTK